MKKTTEAQERTKTNDIRHTIETTDAEGNAMQIKIRLNDECKNGHQDFSITGTVWEKGKPRTDRYSITSGAIGDRIAESHPELTIFNNLHLCDYEGIPMCAVENGFYHLKNGFNREKPTDANFKKTFCDYYRVAPAQFDVLAQLENELRYAIALEKLGILKQWKKESDKAIKMLEDMTNSTFIVDSKKTQFHAPTQEQRRQEEEREQSGYYLPAEIEKRDQLAKEAETAKQYAEIEGERDTEISKANL